MFGRKRQAQVQFAEQTIMARFGLVAGVRGEIDDGVWFEADDHAPGRVALERFLNYVEGTDDVVFLTVNSLRPSVRLRAETVAPELMGMLAFSNPIGGSRAYLAHNVMLRDLFEVDPFDDIENDLRAADATISMGFMRYCEATSTQVMEVFAQSVTVACALAAGWLQSDQRAGLAA